MQRVQPFTYAAVMGAVFTVASAGLLAQTVPADDVSFAQKAAESGRMEVEHGKMAAQKASHAQVKAYGNKLVTDHTAANNELAAIAKRKGIALTTASHHQSDRGSVGAKNDATDATKTGGARPAAPGGNPTGTTGASNTPQTTGAMRAGAGHDQPWMSQTGAAFDKAFVEAQIKAHQDAIALFEKESNSGGDSELKAFAAKQLPGLRAHLKQAQDLQAKLATGTQ